MFIDYEGYWYISRTSIMELLGKKLTVILKSFQKLKKGLREYAEQSVSFEEAEFILEFQVEMRLALQIDALCQSSLEISEEVVSMYTIQGGEEQLRKGDILSADFDGGIVKIEAEDSEDQERSIFYCDGNELSTEDQGVKLSFVRKPTFLFDDKELDAMEYLLNR
jgi:hypothetical protein